MPRKLAPDVSAPLTFSGFPKEAFRFLAGLKKNNNKKWFEAHREEYESSLREPALALVDAMGVQFQKHNMPFVADSRRSLFRINRDIRFSADKSPYKTHFGISFPFEGSSKEAGSGFYVGFEPKGAGGAHGFMGGGVYHPMSDHLKRIRQKIDRNQKEFLKLVSDKTFLKEFPKGLTGESLKRIPKGYSEDHPAASLLKMKQFLFGCDLTADDLLDKKLPDRLIRKFKAAENIAKFLGNV